MFNTQVKSSLKKFSQLFQEELKKASNQAIKATANDVIKVTLPNTLNNTDKNKPASRQRSTFNKNIKALKSRIERDIVGKNGIPSAIPAANGNPIPRTIKGEGNMPFMLINKGKGKRRKKRKTVNLQIAQSPHELIQYIKKNTKLARKTNTYRKRNKGAKIIWITRASIAKQAAKILEKRAGNTLSGWSALASKVQNKILQSLLNSQEVDKQGSATITNTSGKVTLKARNDEVNSSIQSYQQSVVNSSIPKTFAYHLNNAVKRINYNKLRKQIK